MIRALVIRLLISLSGLLAAEARAAHWPSWRGPTGDGIAPETNAPTRWSRQQNVRWIARLPEPGNPKLIERGNSTPIIWGNTIYLTQSIRNRRCVMALDRQNGRIRWTVGEDSTLKERTEGSNPYCSSSPVTDGQRIIAWFGSLGVVAYDPSGKKLWHTDLGPVLHDFGYGSSPVLHKDRVFLNYGPGAREFVAALDASSGKILWTVQGPKPGNDDTYGTWSTPFITTVQGQSQLLVALRDYFAALDPATGKEIWRADGLGLQAKASPVAGDGIAVISGDLRGAEIAVRLGGTGNITDSHRLWRENPPRRRVATGVIRDGHIYGAQSNGLLDCVELETGNVVWAERQSGSGANSAIWSSPILVGDRLYIHNQGGDTVIVKASPKFQQIAVNSIGEPGNASPVIVDGELYLRTHIALWCIRESTNSASFSPSTNSIPQRTR